jgi:hypothetical protein
VGLDKREEYQPRPDVLQLLKLHGSINWAMPGKETEPISIMQHYIAMSKAGRYPALLPPTWQKTFRRGFLDVWNAAVEAIASGTRILVLGFSIPATDVHFKYLLAAGLRNNISLRTVQFVNSDADTLVPRIKQVLREELIEREIVKVMPLRIDEFFGDEARWPLIARTCDKARYLPPQRIPRPPS